MRITGPLLKVVNALGDSPRAMYGLEIMRVTGLASGTLYPLLDRLEASGWVAGRWESQPSNGGSTTKGGRRRFYRLTPKGEKNIREVFQEFKLGGLAWNV